MGAKIRLKYMENTPKKAQNPGETTEKYNQKDLEKLHESLSNVEYLEGGDRRLRKLLGLLARGTYRMVIGESYFMPDGRLFIDMDVSIKAGRADK